MQRTTLVFATIDRPDMVKRLVLSVRKRYPDLPIVIGDQNAVTKAMEALCSAHSVRRVQLDYDCGVTKARNMCVAAASTEYILLADDDFIFTNETDISIPEEILDRRKDIGIIGGSLADAFDDGSRTLFSTRRFERFISYDPGHGTLTTTPIDFVNPRAEVTGSRVYFECDMVLNWALMRREIFDGQIKWDEQFHSNGEHEDFYLNLKQNSSWKVGYCPDFKAVHNHVSNRGYRSLRNRQAGWKLFAAKWGLRDHLELGYGLRTYEDYERHTMSGGSFLPRKDHSYLRVWPNGQCFASDYAMSEDSQISADMTQIRKFDAARKTWIWKICRPFMRLEQSFRKRLRRVNASY